MDAATRKRVRSFFKNKCCLCNISEWRGMSIGLQVDHIDGNNKNNNMENLRLLCPNCHSQTDTYTFKKHQSQFVNKLTEFLKPLTTIEIQNFFASNDYDAICLITGTSTQTIRKFLKENPTIVPKWKQTRWELYSVSKEELHRLLVVEKTPISVLAKEYGVTHNSVRKKAKRAGITIPQYWDVWRDKQSSSPNGN